MHRSFDAIQVWFPSYGEFVCLPCCISPGTVSASLQQTPCANNLKHLCRIQEDCQVCLNTVDNVEQFLQDVNQGRWDAVLPQITHLRLPTEKLYDLYEQIVCEMIEMRETDTARAMLRTMKAFKRLQQDDAERFMRLDRLTNPCAPACRLLASDGALPWVC